jgi:hypothetical protein
MPTQSAITITRRISSTCAFTASIAVIAAA